jgi:hypothetical protein
LLFQLYLFVESVEVDDLVVVVVVVVAGLGVVAAAGFVVVVVVVFFVEDDAPDSLQPPNATIPMNNMLTNVIKTPNLTFIFAPLKNS